MAEADWGGQYRPKARQSSGFFQVDPAQSPYVQPAHGGYGTQYSGMQYTQASFGDAPAGAASAGAGAAPDGQFGGPVGPGNPGNPGGSGSGSGSGGIGRVLHGAGALMSLALIAGLAIWGYKLAMRDVTGVPVVRALAGPMRIQPEDPGGVAAAHQGLAVNAIAADGQAEGPTDEVVLAPAPVALANEDMPARAGAEVSAVLMDEPETASADAILAATEPTAETDAEDAAVAEALAMADAVAAEAAPLSGEETSLAPIPEADTRLALAHIPASVPGVARSPRPAPRPVDLVTRAASSPVALALASADAAASPSVREVASGDVPAGTRLVQLGAFDSADVARSEWAVLAGRFPEILEGKDRVIEMAQSGGKTFYRLRAMGFDDLSDARRFCSALMAGQAACIPVVTR